jgi:hypothetical protein
MINQFAQSTSSCTVNGKPVDCGDFLGAIGAFVLWFVLFIIIFSFICLTFWLLSLIHLIENEDVEERTVWLVLVLLVPFAQFVYYFGPRRTYEKRKASKTKKV